MDDSALDILSDVRERFVREGAEISGQLLESGASLDFDAIKRNAHVWAGAGGMLGYDEITAQARSIEQAIAEQREGWNAEVYRLLQAIHDMFLAASC